MLRRKVQLMFLSHHIIPSLLLLLQFVIPLVRQVATDTEAKTTPDKQLQSDRFALMVDTMFWIGNTEFGERNNWRKHIKPCTLLERIKINEQSVISLGDSMDALGGALESNIKDLVLPLNGMLLLEDDTFSDPLDPLFIQYLNQSGDCFDSSQFSDGATTTTTSNSIHQFEFELDSDQMSWFNPDNWRSSQLDLETNTHLIPDSHMIPCNDDVVVFGSRRMAFGTTIKADERSKTLTFKVNFRPSLALIEELNFTIRNKDLDISQLRVSKFKIDTQSYNEQEFEQLINSNQYENILFQFNDNFSLLEEETGFAYPSHSLLTIDESSIAAELDSDFCLDEAGCICGNENTNVMKAICSFRNPLDLEQLPCHDPVTSSGYCNRICATVLTISMDPTKFKEAFIVHLMTELIGDDKNQLPDYFAESSRINFRRTSETKYEITLSFLFEETGSDDVDYGKSSEIEREFVELFLNQLDNAKRSFYGIKSINFKSSTQWKTDNQKSIFIISFMVVLVGFIANLTFEEAAKNGPRSSGLNKMPARQNDNMGCHASGNWLNALRRPFVRTSALNDGETFIQYAEPIAIDDSNEIRREDSMSEIPLVDLESMAQ